MWPLPPQRVPTSREALLVSLADKYCSLYETLFLRNAGAQASPAPRQKARP